MLAHAHVCVRACVFMCAHVRVCACERAGQGWGLVYGLGDMAERARAPRKCMKLGSTVLFLMGGAGKGCECACMWQRAMDRSLALAAQVCTMLTRLRSSSCTALGTTSYCGRPLPSGHAHCHPYCHNYGHYTIQGTRRGRSR